MYKLGIDLGGTNIVAGVVDEKYRIVATAKRKTNLPRPAEEIVDDLVAVAYEAIENAGLTEADIDGYGIGCPGSIEHETGNVPYSNNLEFYDLPLGQMLFEKTGKKFYVENDANAAAYGEYIAGAGRGTKNFIAITLGTGVGGGIIIDGKIYSGSNGAGGELGHTVIVAGGRQCSCGRRGCWEAYSSATGLTNMTKEKMTELKIKGIPSLLFDESEKEGKTSARTAFNAMRGGDVYGKMLVDEYIAYLAEGITNIINIFQPEVLSIGGGVCNEKEYLTKPLIEIVEREQYTRTNAHKTKIVTAILGNDAGIIGAAGLGK